MFFRSETHSPSTEPVRKLGFEKLWPFGLHQIQIYVKIDVSNVESGITQKQIVKSRLLLNNEKVEQFLFPLTSNFGYRQSDSFSALKHV